MFETSESQNSFSGLNSPPPYNNQPFGEELDSFALTKNSNSALSPDPQLRELELSSATDPNLIPFVQAAIHLVKEQLTEVDWNRGGLIIDDPFGAAQNSGYNDYKRYNYYDYSGKKYTTNTTSRPAGANITQQGQNELGNGNDNFWSWSYCAEVFGNNPYLILG